MDSGRTKIPVEAIELYNRFIHGEISRRAFGDGMKRFAVAGLTATALIDALMPNYALGQVVRADDDRLETSTVTVPSPQGNGSIKGYLVRPISADQRDEKPAKLPGVIVIHENRGLNPNTKDVARRFGLEDFIAFAPDGLTSLGGYPGDDYKGGLMFNKVDKAKMTQDFVAAARWLKSRPDCTGKIGAIGFCFGGSMVNTLAVLLGDDLAAGSPYYGGAPPSADVAKIKAAMLIQHGGLDPNLAPKYPAQAADLKKNNITFEGYVYPNAVHGFFNDATPERYNREAATQAWTRTIDWFNKYVRGGPPWAPPAA